MAERPENIGHANVERQIGMLRKTVPRADFEDIRHPLDVMVEGGARNHDAFGDAGRSRGENHIGQTMTAAASLKLRRLDDFRWIQNGRFRRYGGERGREFALADDDVRLQ